MYLARVAVGKYTTGTTEMKAAPESDGVAAVHTLYDSVVDDHDNPKVFVVFHNAAAYPVYIISFK